MLSVQDLMDLPPVGVEAGAADGLAQDVEVDIETGAQAFGRYDLEEGAQAFGQVPSYSDAEKEAFGPLPFGVEWARFPGTTSLWMLQEKSKWPVAALLAGAGALAALWFFVIRR